MTLGAHIMDAAKLIITFLSSIVFIRFFGYCLNHLGCTPHPMSQRDEFLVIVKCYGTGLLAAVFSLSIMCSATVNCPFPKAVVNVLEAGLLNFIFIAIVVVDIRRFLPALYSERCQKYLHIFRH